MKNSTLREMNIEIYGPICMAGYTVIKQNPLTMHHIIALSKGGKTTFENGSNITSLPHSGIHIISDDNYKKEKQIIDYLFCFKEHPDLIAAKQFAEWLKNEIKQLEYTEYLTKSKTLIYKRRK